MNRGSRIAFPVTSASGILLFRSSAELLIAYSNRLKERGAALTAGMIEGLGLGLSFFFFGIGFGFGFGFGVFFFFFLVFFCMF
jgi:hypothetical protein